MFADLPPEKQIALVQHALHALLGDAPRRTDYLALLVATDNVTHMFWNAVSRMPTASQLRQAGQPQDEGYDERSP